MSSYAYNSNIMNLIQLTLFLLKSVDVILDLSDLLLHRCYFSIVFFHLKKQTYSI